MLVRAAAQELKLPFLTVHTCMDSLGTNFWHGANFAIGGSSILPGGYSPFHLGIQISQFKQFKSRTTASLSSPLTTQAQQRVSLALSH